MFFFPRASAGQRQKELEEAEAKREEHLAQLETAALQAQQVKETLEGRGGTREPVGWVGCRWQILGRGVLEPFKSRLRKRTCLCKSWLN